MGFFFVFMHTYVHAWGGGACFAFQHHIVTPAGAPWSEPAQMSPYYTTYKHLGLAETPLKYYMY
jgi:hypothetical protein